MWLGFDIGLGPFADVPLSRWEEAFVPMRLADSLREATRSRRPPAGACPKQVLLPHRIAAGTARNSPRPWWPWLLVGPRRWRWRCCWLGRRRAARAGRRRAAVLDARAALLGLLMLFIWFGTAHRAGWANQNLLLFNPAVPAVAAGRLAAAARARDAGAGSTGCSALIAICAAVAWFMRWLPFPAQDNTHWIALLLPIHLAPVRGPARGADLAAAGAAGAGCAA